jgi:hypothetical protein
VHISEQERETEREPLGEIINEWKRGGEVVVGSGGVEHWEGLPMPC